MRTRNAGKRLLAVVFAAVIAGACGRHASPRGADRAAIVSLLAAQQDAWNAGDLRRFISGYWDSDSTTFFSGGDVTSGRDSVLARYERRYQGEGREMGRLAFRLREVTLLGRDWALVRGAWSLERRSDSPHGLFTLVLRRVPGVGWKIVHDHTSAAG